jgi:hypothetical protein
LAQNFSGRWTGYEIDSNSGHKQRLVLEIGSHDSLITGVMHGYSPITNDFQDKPIIGQFHLDNLGMLLVDGISVAGLDSNNSMEPGYYRLIYEQVKNEEILKGYWIENDPNKPSIRTVYLERKTGVFVPLPFFTRHQRSQHSDKDSYPEFTNNRLSPVVAQIPFHEDSVKVELYDNGEIDGDSVSLYLNNKLVLTHLELKESAKTLYLHLNKDLPINKLILVAENLGKMPPNTALMEVTTLQNTYNVFLSTDFKKNAMVEFVFDGSN